jgi:pterin-4a-carbinolamine dehydratase
MTHVDYYDRLRKDKAELQRRKALKDWQDTQRYIQAISTRSKTIKKAPDMQSWLR